MNPWRFSTGGGGSSFPLVQSVANSNNNLGFGYTLTVTMPAGIQVGDLLVCLFRSRNSASTYTSGWTKQVLANVYGNWDLYWKVAEGSDSLGIFVSSNVSSATCYRISGATNISANGTWTSGGTTHDPSALTPSGGNQNYLFFASAALSDYNVTLTGTPTGYTDQVTSNTPGNNEVVFSLRKEVSGTTDDPSSFTTSASKDVFLATLAVW